MKLSFSTRGWPYLSWDEMLDTASEMGFSGIEDKRDIGTVFETYPIAFALSVADMEASYFLEGKKID